MCLNKDQGLLRECHWNGYEMLQVHEIMRYTFVDGESTVDAFNKEARAKIRVYFQMLNI